MPILTEANLREIEEDAERPSYWAEPHTLKNLCETIRELRRALGVMLDHCDRDHWLGREAWLADCERVYQATGDTAGQEEDD